jgi:hypothetical protein
MPISRQKYKTVLSYFNIDESSGSELGEVVPARYFLLSRNSLKLVDLFRVAFNSDRFYLLTRLRNDDNFIILR